MDMKKVIWTILKQAGTMVIYIVLGVVMFIIALLVELAKPTKHRRHTGVMCGPGGSKRR